MRTNHELPRGVVCERCKRTVYKGNYVAIRHVEPIVESSSGHQKVVYRYNLCKKCYSTYKNIVNKFINTN